MTAVAITTTTSPTRTTRLLPGRVHDARRDAVAPCGSGGVAVSAPMAVSSSAPARPNSADPGSGRPLAYWRRRSSSSLMADAPPRGALLDAPVRSFSVPYCPGGGQEFPELCSSPREPGPHGSDPQSEHPCDLLVAEVECRGNKTRTSTYLRSSRAMAVLMAPTWSRVTMSLVRSSSMWSTWSRRKRRTRPSMDERRLRPGSGGEGCWWRYPTTTGERRHRSCRRSRGCERR